ncbi:MAG: SIS domain-containing protein [bacterium]|nr:SIS domain-containing protein [bacterium]
MTIRDLIKKELQDGIDVKKKMLMTCIQAIEDGAVAIVETYYKKGGTVYTFGNGGSAADAQHFADELLVMLRTSDIPKDRLPLPAHALSTDSSVMTAIANDMGFENIFSRQLEALAEERDLVVGFSTSGNSLNVVKGIQLAKSRGIKTIAFLGGNGGKLKSIADIVILIPSTDTPRIQECHVAAFHIMSSVLEAMLFREEGIEE